MSAAQAPLTASPPTVSRAAFDTLATLQQLTLEAGLAATPQQLAFRLLNRTIAYCAYDRATLWATNGRRISLLGVSGQVDVHRLAPLAVEWQHAIAALPNRGQAQLVAAGSFGASADLWTTLERRTNGLSAVWLPIHVDARLVAGLWLERWGGGRFTPGELTRLEPLALAYGVAWKAVTRSRGRWSQWLESRRRQAAALLGAALLVAMVLIPVPLRIVAPCETVPQEPLAITAPLAGVIAALPVLPGRAVEAGELLATYDREVALEELKVAEQQVQIVESDLQRARVQALSSPAARAEIALLENRLEQEKTRLRISQHRAAQLEVRAPVAGTVLVDDPHEWRGRPVQVGQRLMLLVDPRRTMLRIELPEHDNIDFDMARVVTVVLDADPRTIYTAKLQYVAIHSQNGRDGRPCFRAEAEWEHNAVAPRVGLQGSAVLYGQRVSLGYWLLRRPLAAVRHWAGV